MMSIGHLLLTIALAGTAPVTPLSPAPGAAPQISIELPGATVALDARGAANIPSDAALSSPGLRFYRLSEDGPAFYFPVEDTLVSWPLVGSDLGSKAEVVIKNRLADSWEGARSFAAPIEPNQGKPRVRFVLARGEWDLAILVPGFAPAFLSRVAANEPVTETAPSALARAARLKARILNARSGKPPEKWAAYIARTGDPKDDVESRFFAKRPIAVNPPSLDYSNLPVGGWELRIEAQGGAKGRQPVSAMKAGGVADLGDVYVTDSGAVRVTFLFPVELPSKEFAVRLSREPDENGSPLSELASTVIRPAARTVVDFKEIEAGSVSILCADPSRHIRHMQEIEVKSNETTEVSITLVPVNVHGLVRRGDAVEAFATVQTPYPDREGNSVSTEADETGAYALKVWASSDPIALVTTPADEKTPFVESVRVEPGAIELAHDVLLPTAVIRGVVLDADTGNGIPNAVILFYSGSEDAQVTGSARGDGDGRFTLRNLNADRVDVRAGHVGYAWAEIKRIEVPPEGKDIEFRLTKGLRLQGIVTDESGTPVPGAIVGLDSASDGLNFDRSTKTSVSGDYEFRDILPGSHALEVLDCAHTLVLRTIDVQPREETPGRVQLDVQLPADPLPLRVHVEDDTGAPVRDIDIQWAVNGIPIPLFGWTQLIAGCGRARAPNADGNLVLHGFPQGTISAFAPITLKPLGRFTYDGSPTTWTIRISSDQ